MPNIFTYPFVRGVLLAVASSTALAGGGAIITSARTNAVQDQRLDTLEASTPALLRKMDDLSPKIDSLSTDVKVLTQRLDDEERERDRKDK